MIQWFKEAFDISSSTNASEDDLKKSGFDPTEIETEKVGDEPFCDFEKDFVDFISPDAAVVKEMLAKYEFYPNTEEHRHELAYKEGGKVCGDPNQVFKVRSIGKQMIKDIGKKLISGNFNLTKISFPIKGMVPRTSLETATYGSCTFPLFMAKAVECESALDKLKFCIAAVVSPNYYMNMFLKPLNPVIGETLEAHYSDGTQIYCEQISHHPPISYFLVIGPNYSYRYYGYYDFQAKAGLNSGKLLNRGRRFIEFQSGEKFEISFPNVEYEGVFMGTLRESTCGSLEIKQQNHKLYFKTTFGNLKKKPEDYFEGQILKNGKNSGLVYGTYMGFVNIDGKRYWDGRKVKPFRVLPKKSHELLPSDSSFRKDLIALASGKMMEAQDAKEQIENLQRKDTKLRKEHAAKKDRK